MVLKGAFSHRYNPALSTIRGLLVLGLYLAGRGFDGPCFIFVGLALKLTEGECFR